VPHLKTRLVPNLNGLHLTIYVVGNEKAVSPSGYTQEWPRSRSA
jgi:hypothetical protein